jgi:hypothetical protein
MSERDVGPGERWGTEVAEELAQSKFGIVCLTPDNLTEPWILFESGALSKTIINTYVCPYLFEVPVTDLQFPLLQFQAVVADEKGSLDLVRGINKASGERGLTEEVLKEAFDVRWPKLQAKLAAVPQHIQGASPRRNEREMLEEALQLIRGMVRRAEGQDRERKMRAFVGRVKPLERKGLTMSGLRGLGGLTPNDVLQDLVPTSVEDGLPEVEAPEPEETKPVSPEPES